MSLQLRLLLLAISGIVVALAITAYTLLAVFDRNVLTRYAEELDSQLIQLSALVRIDADGQVVVRHQLYDVRFQQPVSGHYWQVNEGERAVLRSRSLRNVTIDLGPMTPFSGKRVIEDLVGGAQEKVIGVERQIALGENGERRLRLLVAGEAAVVRDSKQDFLRSTAMALSAVAGLLTLAAWLQVRSGLAPLRSLAFQVEGLRAGRRERIEGRFPGEMTSFVEALNRLLATQAVEVERARANAAKLGHGLKTPLAVLGAECRALRSRGEHEAAASIEKEIGGMNTQITRAIAAARSVGPRQAVGTRVAARPLVERMVGVMRRLPRGAGLDWQIDVVPGDAELPIDQRDLEEMLGNLLDNARKWARGRVRVAVDVAGGPMSIAVDDDGPGIPEDRLADVLAGGYRLDRSVPGTGIGLAIAGDLAHLHGGRLEIADSPLGGTRVTLALGPAGNAATP